jgi:hypothetical protein
LRSSCEDLQDLLNDNSSIGNIETTHSETGNFNDNVKMCVYDLLQHNVSMSKISNVISSVLKYFTSKTASPLPSYATVVRLNRQRLVLAQKQLAEVFSEKVDTTLMTDETSKYGKKFMGYEASDQSGDMWVLGLREIESKSGQDTLTVFKEILSDFDKASEKSASSDILFIYKVYTYFSKFL